LSCRADRATVEDTEGDPMSGITHPRTHDIDFAAGAEAP
jgi:hypothetical protein